VFIITEKEEMRRKVLIILAAITMIALLVAPAGAFGDVHRFNRKAIEHARAIKTHYERELLGVPGVRGVGIGENSGKLGILVLVDKESRLRNIPDVFEDMPTVTQVVGEITAHAINLGVSGSNALICGGYCAGGTIGFKVCDNTTERVDGIITNNHVAASGCPNLCPNNAPLGTDFFSPGVIDTKPVCTTTGATDVGPLNRFVPIVLDGITTNYVDAAFVQSNDILVSNNIQGLGAQNNTVVDAYLGQAVCKSGRTSGVTCGKVTGTNLTVKVNYGNACGVGIFSNMIMYSPTRPYTVMSQPGDSGSPVVDARTKAAVALNFAGTQSGIGIGNPIGAVLSALQVSLCSNASGSSSVPITVTTSPFSGQIVVDGVTYAAPHTFSWETDSFHTLYVTSPQSGGTGTQYVFSSWSDGGSQTHQITTPSAPTTYTASFTTRYQLTTSVNPATVGTVAPDCSAGCWYNSGSTPGLEADANSGYTFSYWSGSISSTGNPASVTMNSPMAVTANFSSTGAAPVATVTPTFLSFGNQNVGMRSAAKAVTLSNTGTAPLIINSIGIGGAYSFEFSQTNNCPIGGPGLAPGAICIIKVTFRPLRRGTAVASLNVSVSAPATSQSVSLSGRGR
jgi:hypothetical protein